MSSRPRRTPKVKDPYLSSEVNGYELIEQLGTGAHGAAYKAHKIGRVSELICVKLIFDDDHAEHEEKNMIILEHLPIVPNYLFSGEIGDVKVLGMTLAHTDTIQTFLDKVLMPLDENRRPLPSKFTNETTVRVLFQCIDALKLIHQLKIAHTDLKTDNLFVTIPYHTGRAVRVIIGDFGMATRFQTTNGRELLPEPNQPEFFVRETDHSTPAVHKRRVHGYLEDIQQISYIGLKMAGFNMAVEYPLKKDLLEFKIELARNPALVIPKESAWLVPFFLTIIYQNPMSIDYENLKNCLRTLIPGQQFNENLRLRKIEQTTYLE